MATARTRSDTGPSDRLSRLLATATGTGTGTTGRGHEPAGEDDVWAELLAEQEELLDEAEEELEVLEDDLVATGEPTSQAAPPPGAGRAGRSPARGRSSARREPFRGRHRAERAVPVITPPVAFRAAQLSVPRAAVLGLVLVLVVATAVVGVRWWVAEQSSAPRPLPPDGRPAPVAAGPAAGGSAPGDTGESPSGVAGNPSDAAEPGPGQPADPESTAAARPLLRVHVDGQVRNPGVVELQAGARVLEAVDAAGGVTSGADLTRINLARPVADGERVWIPAPGEEVPGLVDGGAVPTTAGPATGGGEGAVLVVDLNSANQAALEELPGVGPATAQAILAWREENGGFSSVDELLEVSGIGEKTLERLRPHVRVG
jgi:competence protein ComEA